MENVGKWISLSLMTLGYSHTIKIELYKLTYTQKENSTQIWYGSFATARNLCEIVVLTSLIYGSYGTKEDDADLWILEKKTKMNSLIWTLFSIVRFSYRFWVEEIYGIYEQTYILYEHTFKLDIHFSCVRNSLNSPFFILFFLWF